ncbi:MAG: pyridine nucleotide transhydrogenase [Actinobacteria bacterium RBG_19FT_COMBO_70_19]|nr:MAG: pyridine nucleotide transhydrogenase [Actinobacteria bacterium RBG_19FT_COMBO_70_19]
MDEVLESSLYIFALASFLGYAVITRVPGLLHTPLMSLTNALSAISLVGSLILAGAGEGTMATVLGSIAVFAAMTNVVSGFLITDRMLKMFRRREPTERVEPPTGEAATR